MFHAATATRARTREGRVYNSRPCKRMPLMDAERLNAIATTLSNLDTRVGELRRYL